MNKEYMDRLRKIIEATQKQVAKRPWLAQECKSEGFDELTWLLAEIDTDGQNT